MCSLDCCPPSFDLNQFIDICSDTSNEASRPSKRAKVDPKPKLFLHVSQSVPKWADGMEIIRYNKRNDPALKHRTAGDFRLSKRGEKQIFYDNQWNTQCECSSCGKRFNRASDLKQHMAGVHDVGVVWHVCKHPDCVGKGTRFKRAGTLKQHMADVHDVGVVWHVCEHPDCVGKGLRFKQARRLKQHMAGVHDVGVVWHDCEHPDCVAKGLRFKQARRLKQHMANIHDVGVVWHVCEHPDCVGKGTRFKQSANLKKHYAHVHDIGVVWHVCEHPDCVGKGTRFKQAGSLKIHLADVHDIGVVWHVCEHHDCVGKDRRFKQSGNLKSHMAFVHDIGPHTCSICLGKCARLTKYSDKHGTHSMCRVCYSKVTGFKCRIEKTMVEYLDKHYDQPMLRQDQRVNGEACLAYRPDTMYADTERVVHVACDEHQHTRSPHYTCDEKRMSDIYDEYAGKMVIWIRWNPDNYTPPKGTRKLTRKERLEALVRVLREVENRSFDTTIHVIYMFYDVTNPLLVQNIAREMIYY